MGVPAEQPPPPADALPVSTVPRFHGMRESRRPMPHQSVNRQLSGAEEIDEETLEAIRQNWCFGSERFRDERRMEPGLGAHHSGALHTESSRIRAERIVAEELGRLGWAELDLLARRKNAPEKLALAAVAQRNHVDRKGNRRASRFRNIEKR